MATIHSFEELEIWQLARRGYGRISNITKFLRTKKEYRFAEQIKSAAGSIMDNIAEGFERNSRLEFLHSLTIAKGECGEVRSQIYRLKDDGAITDDEFMELSNEYNILSKKIANFVKYLNATGITGLKFKDRN